MFDSPKDQEPIRLAIESVPGVLGVGDLHIWSIAELPGSATKAGLASTVQVIDAAGWPAVREQIVLRLQTLQFSECVLEPRFIKGHTVHASTNSDLGLTMALRYEQQWQSERQELATSLNRELAQHTATIKTLAHTIQTRLEQDAELGSARSSLANIASLLANSSDALFDNLRTILSSIRSTDPDQSGLLEVTRSLVSDTRLAEPSRRIELFLQPEEQKEFGLGDEAIEALAFKLVQQGLQASLDDAFVKTTVVSLRSAKSVLNVHISDDGQAPGTKQRPLPDALNIDLRNDVENAGGIFNLGRGDSGGFELWVTLPWPTV